MDTTQPYQYFDRDLSWLSFNERILMEAARAEIPVKERMNFLGIFSSNLDEFYRVRMPAILALSDLGAASLPVDSTEMQKLSKVRDVIANQFSRFGQIMLTEVLPALKQAGIDFHYNTPNTERIDPKLSAFFYEKVAADLQMVWLDTENKDTPAFFFPENDRIYLLVTGKREGVKAVGIILIPSGSCSRFVELPKNDQQGTEVWMLDDIIRLHLNSLAKSYHFEVQGIYSFKLSRDADIDYKDEYTKDLAGFIQNQITKRNYGLATRLLYDGSMPDLEVEQLRKLLKCTESTLVKGGRYHNLKDLMKFPVKGHRYKNWPPQRPPYAWYQDSASSMSLLDQIAQRDLLVSTPYQDYNTVLRFFNEAAISADVTHIAITIYRIAADSMIAEALMTAAKNGKKVTVFVELKARFDEANNIKWAARMKKAGVKIVYSIWAMKVHAKIALVKRKIGGRLHYSGIIATGNFNEHTAGLYADHILMTADKDMLADMEMLMLFLYKRKKPDLYQYFKPRKLLIAGFNLLDAFLEKIKLCTVAAKEGRHAAITIKLNNLEEKCLIDALYEASRAGVLIKLMVRSICRLVPGVKDMSENISVFRLVDRYLEHSRVFIFEAGEDTSMYIGSADWMNRNIYRRIEVCCPVEDPEIAKLIRQIVDLQFADNVHLVQVDAALNNEWVSSNKNISKVGKVEAQEATYRLLGGTP